MRAVRLSLSFQIFAGMLIPLFAGCTTPSTRAREKPAAWRLLSPADQRLALRGRIREGFSKDAVYIAWGAPTQQYPFSVRQEPFDFWVYSHVEYGVAGGYFGVSRGFHYNGRYIDPTPPSGGMANFYAAPPQLRGFPPPETEVPYKKAVFDHDHVIDYQSLHGDSASTNGQVAGSGLKI